MILHDQPDVTSPRTQHLSVPSPLHAVPSGAVLYSEAAAFAKAPAPESPLLVEPNQQQSIAVY